ncbi:MAG: ribosomal protein S18-alanine N-acetyltransferase [Candidatus Coatesbacteria bacterium]
MMEFVPFGPQHLDAVTALEAEVFQGREPWSRQAFEGELINSQAVWIVARAGTAVIGYAGGWAGGAEFHLLNLGVAVPFRRRGAGRGLVRAVLGAAAARGCRRATLEVRSSNEGARALYESFGFRSAGVRPRHYGNGEDAVIYWLDAVEAVKMAL